MTQDTHHAIFEAAKYIFAERGYDGLSMRALAAKVGISLSVIYHHYSDKDVLLKEVFDETNTRLGKERAKLKPGNNLDEDIMSRVKFQFDHILDVVFVLKYYLHFRESFPKQRRGGFVPDKASLHILEILQEARSRGELRPGLDIESEAKIITHAINGFLLEYFPASPGSREKQRLVQGLHAFIMRSLTPETALNSSGGAYA